MFCCSTIPAGYKSRNGAPGSHPLEIGALGDGEVLEVAAQAVEAKLDGAEAHPVAAAIDTRAPGFDTVLGGDCEMDAATEIDAVGTIIDLDQHLKCVGNAGLPAMVRGCGSADRTWTGNEPAFLTSQ